MKITYISSDIDDDTGRTRVSLNIQSDLSPAEAISSVLALFAGTAAPVTMKNVIDELPSNDRPRDAQVDEAVAAAAAPKTTRTRRPRTNPDAAPLVKGEAPDEASLEQPDAPPAVERVRSTVSTSGGTEGQSERRRTRVTQEPAAETVKTITDADLAKACSNAAAIVGIEVVQAVIKDFHAANMQELAPDVREKFLGELDDEIRMAREELAALAGAGK